MSHAAIQVANGVFYAMGVYNHCPLYRRKSASQTLWMYYFGPTWRLVKEKAGQREVDVLYESHPAAIRSNQPPAGKWTCQQSIGTCTIRLHYPAKVRRLVATLKRLINREPLLQRALVDNVFQMMCCHLRLLSHNPTCRLATAHTIKLEEKHQLIANLKTTVVV